MKKIVLLLALLMVILNCLAQKADSVQYCEVVTCSKSVSTSVNTVFVVNYAFDFGDGKQFTPENPLKDDKGNEIEFKGPADMMKYMSGLGYDLISTFGFPIKSFGGERWLTHYTFRKILKK